ncbi:ABC transporter permease subunit [Undibacterium terreum]|uniref:ABC transporter permease n=1 Tax=Undibacterium terreum TaxID=1224302 RepID=A0A916XNV9_9BURK|nr:ABC transporter permease subunit [Undibacterium terreum]GGC90560.1 ABC transporter permease [Undibacterium terreum]
MSQASISPRNEDSAPAAPPHGLVEFWTYFRQNRGAVIGLAVVAILAFCALFADIVAPHSAIEQFRDYTLTPPSWQAGGNSKFLLGTDSVGRDILSRLIHGSRLSLIIGIVSVSLSMAAGVCLGLVAGFARSWNNPVLRAVETVIMRLMDILQSLPSLLLAIAVVAILGPGLINAMYAIAIVLMPSYARLTRAAVHGELNKDYVNASRIAGAGTLRLMFNCVLPNCTAPLIVQATLGISTAILDAAALGFLGLGAQPPTPEWGSMLASATEFIQSAWWVVTFPGLTIVISVLAFNLMGDGLRDALDPKLKR